MVRQYTKLMLRAFNGESDAAVANVTTREDIENVVAQCTGLPVDSIRQSRAADREMNDTNS
jgi:hypothetical protein